MKREYRDTITTPHYDRMDIDLYRGSTSMDDIELCVG